ALTAGRELEVPRGPPALITVFSVPAADFRRALERVSPGKLPAAREFNAARAPLKSEAAEGEPVRIALEPGTYVVEESQKGFRKRQRLQVASFWLGVLPGPGPARAFVHHAVTGAPLEGVGLRVRSSGGAVEGRTGPDGLFSFEAAFPATIVAWSGDEVHGF